jgi:hypothetical protein
MNKIPTIANVALKAINLVYASEEVKMAKAVLDQAYRNWKHENADDFVARDSAEWDAMMVATAGEYAEVKKAKRKARNAMCRLNTAVKAV